MLPWSTSSGVASRWSARSTAIAIRWAPCRGSAMPAISCSPESKLFADAKPAENDAQQVVGREFTGNLAERLLRQAQFLGEQFERRQAAFDHLARRGNVFLGVGQGPQVAFAGDEDVLGLM